MTFAIRPFVENDYAALAEILAVVYDRHLSGETLRQEELTRPAHCLHAAWVAEAEGRVVAYAEYGQYAGAYHPRKFELGLAVLPGYRRRGIGSAMYRQVVDALKPHDPIALNAGTREDWPEGMSFAVRRGFREKMRNWESHLDLAAWDPQPFESTVQAALLSGYEFLPYPNLAGGEDRDRQIHAMGGLIRRDIPSPQPMTDVPFEQWVKNLARPTFFPEAYWLARKDGQLVGLSTIWMTDEAGVAETGMTGVLREHRGAGVAKALKICALTAAKARGYRLVKTWNAKSNEAMLAVNAWLGFVRRPGWVAYVNELQPE